MAKKQQGGSSTTLERREHLPVETRTGKAEVPVYRPPTDILEGPDGYTLYLDMPGVDEKHLSLTVDKENLVIHAEVEPDVPEGYSLAFAEYNVGDLHRAFALPADIDRSKVEGTLRDGVLQVVLPRSEDTRPRKIQVKTQQ